MDDLPLIELFLQLVDADLPLGIDEYRLLLRALQLGFGAESPEALRKVCHTLWAKSAQERRLFDYHFKRMVQAWEAAAKETGAAQETRAKETAAELGTPPNEETPAGPRPAQPGSAAGAAPAAAALAAEPDFAQGSHLVHLLGDEVHAARTIETARLHADLPARRFILSGEYFPVTQRQMKQSWRYLRRMLRSGPATELDVEETVQKIGREGCLLAPTMRPRRLNRTELLLMVDRQGSMLPFHDLAGRLAETARWGGRLGRAGVYYFHDVPEGYLFEDVALVDARPAEAVLQRLSRERTVALIFSDAGAARGGPVDQARVDLTRDFIHQLKGAVLRVAWLNPMPEDRWRATTAARIAGLAPMFECTRRGLDEAVDTLRGRHTAGPEAR